MSPASVRASHKHRKTRQCMRTSHDATAYQSPGTLKNGFLGPGTATPPTCCRTTPATIQEEDQADEQNRRRQIHPGPHHDDRQLGSAASAPAGPGSPGPAHYRPPCPAAPLSSAPALGLPRASVSFGVPAATRDCHPQCSGSGDPETSISRSSLAAWRHGGQSAVKNAGCSSSGSGFGLQHPHSGLQPSVISIPGDPKPSSELLVHQARTLYTEVHNRKTLIHVN